MVDSGGKYLRALVDADGPDGDVLNACEVSPEQWGFDRLLRESLYEGGPLAQAYAGYQDLLGRQPEESGHFGIRLSSVEELDEIVSRIESLSDHELAGRLEVVAVFRPGSENSLSDRLAMAFLRTDVFSVGLLSLPQHIELQAELPVPTPA